MPNGRTALSQINLFVKPWQIESRDKQQGYGKTCAFPQRPFLTYLLFYKQIEHSSRCSQKTGSHKSSRPFSSHRNQPIYCLYTKMPDRIEIKFVKFRFQRFPYCPAGMCTEIRIFFSNLHLLYILSLHKL